MYLEKLAYIHKIDNKAEFKKLQAGLDDKNATPEERVEKLRKFWNKKLSVDDVTKMPGYDPEGEYQLGFLDRNKRGGQRVQFRPDVSKEALDKEMSGYALSHEVTGGNSLTGLIEMVLENNGIMASTVEKMRMGIAPRGMSPISDMGTGGASYFFTRIAKMSDSSSSKLYFKKDMLRRMDAISYNSDCYGKVVGDFVRDRRASKIEEWKEYHNYGSNETIFKGSVSLVDNIDIIVVDDLDEKTEIIQSFKKRAIGKLPDGRRIEDIVFTSQEWRNKK
jgi:hypothetical protein